MANYQDILKRAIQIRDAVSEGANTASLVGGVMVDTLYNQNKLKQDIDGIIDSLKDLSKSDSSGGIDEITLANYLIRNGYAKKSDIPTSWWGQAKNENNEVGGSLHNVLSLLFSDSEIEITGVANANTPTSSNEKIVTPSYAASKFLSKLEDDLAKGTITFEKMQKFLSGFESNDVAKFLKGLIIGNNGYTFDENGNIIADSLKSLGFDKALNEGFGMEMETAGTSHLYLSNLTVWGKMMVNVLEIMKTKYAGGNIYLSAAGGTIVKAVPVIYVNEDAGWEETSESWCEGWKCYILADDGDEATTNPWVEGDQVRCQSMGNLMNARYAQAANKSYWRTIVKNGVSAFNEYIYNDYGTPAYNGKKFYWIVLGKHTEENDGYTEKNAPAGTNDIPEAGDSIVLDGSRKDTSRQGVLQLSSYGSGAPSIVGLRGVSDYSHENCAIFELSYDNVKILAERFKLIAKSGDVEITNFRGEWSSATEYYKNDQVSHNNAIWTCLADNTASEPTDENTGWRKEVYGQKGEDGSSFKVLGTAVKHFANAEDIGGELLNAEKYLFDDTSGLPDGVASPCIATYLKAGAGHTWVICKSNDGDSYMIGDDLWTNSGSAWLNIGNVKGVSISSTSVTYGVSASGTQQPTSWYSAIPSTTDDEPYLWTKTVVEYSDGKSTTSYSVSHNGKDGAKGDPGDKGADAITIQLVNAPLVFDTDDSGIVPKGVTKYARLYVTEGGKDVSRYVEKPLSDIAYGSNVSDDGYTYYKGDDGSWYLGIKSDGIGKVYLSDNKTEVSATSGYVTFHFLYNGVQYTSQLPFQVNVARYTGELTLTTKQFQTDFSELSNDYNSLPLKDSAALAEYTSTIQQTAREISLSVSEKAMGRRNMLPGSAFRKGDDGFEMSIYGDFDGSTYTKGYRGNQGIFMNGGVSGSNFFRAKSYYDGSEQQYAGLFWRGGGASKNIKVQANKKYALSCWVKCDRTDVTIALETLYKASETTTTRQGRPSSTTSSFQVSKSNTWQLISCIVTTDGSFNYMEVNFWVSHMINGVTATACFCHPMFEEAEEYNGWTLSELDYDYIGGNLIDNSRTFASGGNCNVRTQYGSVIANGYNSESSVFKARMEALAGSVPSKYSLPSSASSGTRYALDSDWSVWQYNGNSLSDDSHYNGWQKTNESLHQDIMLVNLNLELNKDYIISWYAKCEGKGLFGAYAAGVGKTVYSEYSDGGIDQSTYGENAFFLTTQWKRFWMHVKLIKGSCSAIAFRQYRGDVSSGSSAMTVYFTQPKIEEGATVTDWTEKRTDMVDRQALLATGIDITNGKITITADKTYFQDNNGVTTAMFEDGKIRAGLIDADQIEVKHLWAKSEDGAVKVGYFGNTEEDACKLSDGTLAPLFIGGDTAAKSPFCVTSNGAMHAMSGKIGPFWISPDMFKDCLVSGTFENAPDSFKYTNYIKLSKDLLELVGKTSMVSDIAAGSMERVRITADMSKIDDYLNPIYVKVDGVPSYLSVAGIVVDAIGGFDGQDARAFWARKGSYGGFRRDCYSMEQATSFNAGTVCCEGYGIVLMSNTAPVTITLPKSMDGLEAGSELIVIRGSYNIVFSGAIIRRCGTGLISGTLTSTIRNELIHLYYFGSDIGWFVNFESYR